MPNWSLYQESNVGLISVKLKKKRKKDSVIHYVSNRIKKKNYTIILINTDEVFDKIQQPLVVTTVSSQGTDGNFLNVLQGNY